MAKLLELTWINRLNHYPKIHVGFSGGLDSTVLLHCLVQSPELKEKLSAIHVHHGLSAYADEWQQHTQNFCNTYEIPLIVLPVIIDKQANIEERARHARYEAFASCLNEKECLLLAHHCDDQAETVLLQLLRGSGVDGMAAMPTVRSFAKGEIIRPLLHISRQALEKYATHHQLSWIEDDSNLNLAFSRNYLRHQILPLLRDRWPNALQNIASCANHCQDAKTNLDFLAQLDGKQLTQISNQLDLNTLLSLDSIRLNNVLRFWLKCNHVKMPSAKTFRRILHEVIQAEEDAQPEVAWGNVRIRRYRKQLYVYTTKSERSFESIHWSNFPCRLSLPDGRCLIATKTEQGLPIPMNAQVEVRFRQGGENFHWRGQTKVLKKLFQQWAIPSWERDHVPLLYVNGKLIAVLGFAESSLETIKSDAYYTIAIQREEELCPNL